ncbi:uncharacterized protein LOC112204025 [Rosa chinensis]|uniref:uncharacterized protein LOC112204025 n=1 Tax=Rosa chinensis TaxID=74649 RepID=UPI000D09655B|nr:uncharacterized protein LOC112204025 [Rosa chinensis]
MSHASLTVAGKFLRIAGKPEAFELRFSFLARILDNRKSGLLHRLPTFHGLSVEDPNQHLMEFQFICSRMKPHLADENILKLKAFPFSLADKAKQWLYELPSGHITSWDDMMKAFLVKYFPTSRIIMLRKKISGIQQGVDESYADYHERFKSLLAQCPQHGIKDETLLTCFYEGLTNLEIDMLDDAFGGSFMDKFPAAGMALIQSRASNQQQYRGTRSTTRARVNEVLTTKGQGMAMTCGVCSMQGHPTDKCPQLMGGEEWEQANAIGFQGGQKYDPFSNTYNARLRDHPKFRWRNNDNVQGLPQNTLIQVNTISKDVEELKKQMSQMIGTMNKFHEQGKLPSQTIPNPKGGFKTAQAITTRSGKTLGDAPKAQKNVHMDVEEEEKDPAKSKKELKASPNSEQQLKPKGNDSNLSNLVIANYSTPMPFPNRFAQSKKDESEKVILETFKKVQVNIPLLKAIKQVSKYAKFLKELCTTRRRQREKEVVKVSENVSSVIQRKLPPKCKDPGSFTIPCVIGNNRFENAMLDLGAAINVIPYYVYASLDLGELKTDNVIIQLADRSKAYPKGLVEDVLV